MGKIKSIIRKLKAVSKKDHEAAILNILKKWEKYILNLNKQQLIGGRDSEGNSLGKYKSKSYAKFKLSLNPRGVVDLRLNGNFWDSFYLATDKFPASIDAHDEKRNKLVGRYGKNIFGLDDNSMEVLRIGIRKDIQKYYRDFIKKSL